MSVTVNVQLPDQPTTSGLVQHIPLGGNGFNAPRGAYVVQRAGATGDATAGKVQIRLLMDQVYCSLVAYISWTIVQGTPANVQFRSRLATLQTDQTDIVAEQLEAGVNVFIAANLTTEGFSQNRMWDMTPIILPGDNAQGIVDTQWANIEDDEYALNALIYLFDVRVRSVSPMGPLLWARGAT